MKTTIRPAATGQRMSPPSDVAPSALSLDVAQAIPPSGSEMSVLVANPQQQSLAVATSAVPAIPPGGGLLALEGAGLCGSDVEKILSGRAQEHTVLGHEVVGRLVALAPDAPALPFEIGQRLVVAHHIPCGRCHYCFNQNQSMCRQFKASNFQPGGFSQWIALSAEHLQYTAFPIPDEIPNTLAVHVEPLACVLRGIRRGGTTAPDSVAVVGLGYIGLLAAQCYQRQGTWVLGLDVQPERCALAQTHGWVQASHHPADPSLASTLKDHTATGGVDVVYLTVINPASLATALSCVRDGGTIVQMAGPLPDPLPDAPEEKMSAVAATAPCGVDLATLYYREITWIPSYSPALTDLQTAARLIFQQHLLLTPLITHGVPWSQADQAVALYRSGQAIKVYLDLRRPS
ncbi:MAG: alcohol dehydrogenase catalytic domain-containing protein [Candidatus Melainabacteria bacterium]|nr:alcohol dehydrogenase catalytic domain-containing protein [Candidatus Melainabacteria bacterium]